MAMYHCEVNLRMNLILDMIQALSGILSSH